MFEFSRRLTSQVLLATVTIFGVAVVLRTAVWHTMPWTFLEAAFYAVLFFGFFSLKPVRRYFSSLPTPHRAVFAAFLALMLTGQLADKPWLTFPFPTWNMYTMRKASDPVAFYELRGFARDGASYEIDPGHLAGDRLMKSPMVTLLVNEARGAYFETHPEEERERHKRKLEDFMRAAGRVYNQRHPGQTVKRVELYRAVIDLQKKGEAAFEREKLCDVSL